MTPTGETEQQERLASADAVNLRFALVQRLGTRVALTTVIVAFALYVGGLVQPLVPLARMPALLHLDSHALARAEGVPTGWGWLAAIGYGDMLSLGALLLLVGVVAAAYIALLPVLVRLREWKYLVLVLVQLAVFALAASGG